MSALVVDTSAWVWYLRGQEQKELDSALQDGHVHLPPIVVAELFSGKLKPTQRAGLEDLIRDLPLCETPLEHWIRVGELRRRLGAKGFQISTPDAHVAQCALDLDGRLLTEDRVFALIARHTSLELAGRT